MHQGDISGLSQVASQHDKPTTLGTGCLKQIWTTRTLECLVQLKIKSKHTLLAPQKGGGCVLPRADKAEQSCFTRGPPT